MAFWNRKKEDKPSEKQTELLRIQERFRERLDEIDRIANPDDRYVKMERLRNDIRRDAAERLREIERVVRSKKASAFGKSNVVAIAASVGVLFATGVSAPLIIAMWFPGALGSGVIADKVGKSAKKSLETEYAEIFSLLDQQDKALVTAMEKIENDRREAIARKKQREETFRNLPAVNIGFDDAAKKRGKQKSPSPRPSKRKKFFPF